VEYTVPMSMYASDLSAMTGDGCKSHSVPPPCPQLADSVCHGVSVGFCCPALSALCPGYRVVRAVSRVGCHLASHKTKAQVSGSAPITSSEPGWPETVTLRASEIDVLHSFRSTERAFFTFIVCLAQRWTCTHSVLQAAVRGITRDVLHHSARLCNGSDDRGRHQSRTLCGECLRLKWKLSWSSHRPCNPRSSRCNVRLPKRMGGGGTRPS
jgi:hypothetical protein